MKKRPEYPKPKRDIPEIKRALFAAWFDLSFSKNFPEFQRENALIFWKRIKKAMIEQETTGDKIKKIILESQIELSLIYFNDLKNQYDLI